MDSKTGYHFNSTTQFVVAGDLILLRQGHVDIASGSFTDWLVLFQSFNNFPNLDVDFNSSEPLAGTWSSNQQAWCIHSPPTMTPCLYIQAKDLKELEHRLLELHQGCCDPMPFNIIADICQQPDERLMLLQTLTHYVLTAAQLDVAKRSIAELPVELEIDVRYLYQLWETDPSLAYFAKALRFYILSE